jgi:hypothetical protein
VNKSTWLVTSVCIHRFDRDFQLLVFIQTKVHFFSARRSFINFEQIVVFIFEVNIGGIALFAKSLACLWSIVDVQSFHKQAVILDIFYHLAIALVHILCVTLNIVR